MLLENIELKWLLSFKGVYEAGSFKLAAEQLQQPTSNISRHVALLEQALNVRLFERTTRKMAVSTAGEHLYHGLSPLLIAMADTLQEVQRQGDSIAGHLKIIAPDLPFLADATAQFCALHPRIHLSYDTQLNPAEGILEGFDIVFKFARGALEDSGWVAKEILRLPSCVVAAPKLLQHYNKPRSLKALARVPCITSLSVLQGMPWRFKNGECINVTSAYKVNSGQLAKAAALNALGFAILPLTACREELQSGELLEIELPFQPEDLVLYAYYSGKKYQLAKVTEFLDFIKQSIKEQC
ncbi:LysR family transcriptional regulator [Pseudoalteromonas phenolica]|nr:LysR family transcriptional regulator [Pseudoalteromonas phenolica]